MYIDLADKIYKFLYSDIVLPDNFYLSKAQEIKLAKFTFQNDQEKYIKRHYSLNKILDNLSGKSEICYDHNGRLYVNNSDINISISYTNDYFVIAMSHKNKLGIDIEKISILPDIMNQAKIFLNKAELDYFIISKQNILVFYKYWTAKEAILKSIGLGLLTDIKNLNICLKSKTAIFNNGKYQKYQSSFSFVEFKNYLTCIAYVKN